MMIFFVGVGEVGNSGEHYLHDNYFATKASTFHFPLRSLKIKLFFNLPSYHPSNILSTISLCEHALAQFKTPLLEYVFKLLSD